MCLRCVCVSVGDVRACERIRKRRVVCSVRGFCFFQRCCARRVVELSVVCVCAPHVLRRGLFCGSRAHFKRALSRVVFFRMPVRVCA